jgi:hypothetical protein
MVIHVQLKTRSREDWTTCDRRLVLGDDAGIGAGRDIVAGDMSQIRW